MKRVFKFAATSDHSPAPWLNEERFDVRVKDTNLWNKPNEFVTFYGYEGAGGGTGGSNVYFLNEYRYIPQDIPCKMDCFKDNMSKLISSDKFIIINHPQPKKNISGIFTSWRYPGKNEGYEYFSMWNVLLQMRHNRPDYDRWYYLDVYRQGIQLGIPFFVTGDSDTHDGVFRSGYIPQPGWQTNENFPIHGAHAYTFVSSDQLTRDSLWQGLKNKQTYAGTMGIYMDFQMTEDGQPIAKIHNFNSNAQYKIKLEVIHGPSLTTVGYSTDANVSIYQWDHSDNKSKIIHKSAYIELYKTVLDVFPDRGDVFWVEGEVGHYDSYVSTPFLFEACMTISDLINAVNEWKQGTITMPALVASIKDWKNCK